MFAVSEQGVGLISRLCSFSLSLWLARLALPTALKVFDERKLQDFSVVLLER